MVEKSLPPKRDVRNDVNLTCFYEFAQEADNFNTVLEPVPVFWNRFCGSGTGSGTGSAVLEPVARFCGSGTGSAVREPVLEPVLGAILRFGNRFFKRFWFVGTGSGHLEPVLEQVLELTNFGLVWNG